MKPMSVPVPALDVVATLLEPVEYSTASAFLAHLDEYRESCSAGLKVVAQVAEET
jgi:hypothetical protein